MVVEVSDIVTINFVLVKEKDILHAGSEKEADEIMMMLQHLTLKKNIAY
jgi:hypothetical protein